MIVATETVLNLKANKVFFHNNKAMWRFMMKYFWDCVLLLTALTSY